MQYVTLHGNLFSDRAPGNGLQACCFFALCFSCKMSEPTHKKGRKVHYELLDHPCRYGI